MKELSSLNHSRVCTYNLQQEVPHLTAVHILNKGRTFSTGFYNFIVSELG
jgi:hypothetical protein